MERMRTAALAVALGALTGSTGAAAMPGAVAAGERKAAACTTCHGREGMASLPEAPNLAGQNTAYFERALKEYRSGTRRHEVMSVAARGLTDEDIRDLAAYYAAFRVTVTPPGE
jgi:cytochrome c553